MSALRRSQFVRDTAILQVSKMVVTALGLLSTLVVTRLLGPAGYGTYDLADSLLVLFSFFDFLSLSTSASSLIGQAIGARDAAALTGAMAAYVRLTLIASSVLIVVMLLLAPPLASQLHENSTIGVLAAALAFTYPADSLYGLVVQALLGRRSVRELAWLQVANQAILTVCMVGAVVVAANPLSLIIGRLIYSYSTLALAWALYHRWRTRDEFPLPPMMSVFANARQTSARAYLRFGVANALDKNLGNLVPSLARQVTGAVGGVVASGYLGLALRGFAQTSLLTSAIFETMQGVVPQAVGRGDYATLWRQFSRVAGVLALGGIVFYGLIALLTPLLVPPLFGEEWRPAIPAVLALCAYGAITTVGGIFGPLYRAFHMFRAAILAKVVGIAVAIPLGLLLTSAAADSTSVAAGGAAMVSLMFAISVGLTAASTLPVLRAKAQSE